MDFQEHLVSTMMALEDTYFSMAEKCAQNVLIIADRGVMDASAFIAKEAWDRILNKLNLEEIEISDNRYNHVVHLQSAAIGAEKFYTTEDHSARFEGIELARDRDRKAMEAWRDHPYVDIIDNRSDFDSKINRLIDLVVKRIGIDVGDRFVLCSQKVIITDYLNTIYFRFRPNSRKVKFVVSGMCPDSDFPVKFTDFQVEIIDMSHNDRHYPLTSPGCAPLPPLRQEGVPDEAEEESAERAGDLHLHRPQAGDAGPGGRDEAADISERLQQPSLPQVTL